MVCGTLIILTSLVPYARSARIGVDEEVLDADSSFDDGPHFVCPTTCLQCCQQLRSLTGLVGGYFQDRRHFKCITRTDENIQRIPGYFCSDPEPRVSNPDETKHRCEYQGGENSREMWRELAPCGDTNIVSYEEFLGEDSCSVSHTGSAIAHIFRNREFGLGRIAIDALQLTNDHDIAGGVCNNKGSDFFEAGLAGDSSLEDLQEEICTSLEADLAAKRLDPFVMAMWSGRVGPPPQYNMTRPSASTQILPKFQLPGWPTRVVASEAMRDDMRPIDLRDGLFQCALLRFRGVPVTDDLNSGDNQWAASSSDPTAPADPAALHWKYFGRWSAYQTPFHFVVPQNELNSDRILEQFVFQSVGAHHVEFIGDYGRLNADSINPTSLGGCPQHGAPIAGCPFPMAGVIVSIPEDVRRNLRYGVRMEGLFDDAPLRPGLAKWGGNAFFDGEGYLQALQYSGKTITVEDGDSDWEYFKFVFRSSLLGTITVFDHLVVTHIVVAETLAISTTEKLGAHHGLRKLIHPHIVGSLPVNIGAAVNLFPSGMLVHRASPFHETAFAAEDGSPGILWSKTTALRYQKFEDTYRTYRQLHQTLVEDREDLAPELPFFEDGVLLFDEIRKYVDSAVDTIYDARNSRCSRELAADMEAQRFVREFWALTDPSTPNFWPSEFRNAGRDCSVLKAFLTECIFLVTGWHRHVGSVADFFRDTRFTATSWKEGELNARPKHAVLMMTLAATTNAILPKLSDDVSELLFGDSPELTEISLAFQSGLLGVQNEIEQRNELRSLQGFVPFHQMEPTSVEWGVQV